MDERIHRWLAVAAFGIALTAFVGWRSLGSAASPPGGTPPKALPSPQLMQLMPYSRPLDDTADMLSPGRADVVLPRDPFGEKAAPVSVRSAAGQPAVTQDTVTHWRVSATMIGGARRAAIINDVLLYIGDTVPGGGRLTAVERDHVVVTDAKGTAHLLAVKEGDE